jgi:hypothetical protein
MLLIRRCLIVVAALEFLIGCNSSDAPTEPLRTSAGPAATSGARHAPDPAELVDQAITAFGGADGRELLRRGYVKLKIDGELPGLSEQFSGKPITFEAHFDLPDFERRDIYAEADGEHLLIISNSGRLWAGDKTGKGTELPAPPPSAYHGPFLVGMMQSIVDLRDNASEFVIVDADPGSSVDIVEVHIGDDISTRLSLETATHLPVRVEKISPSILAANLGEAVETVTLFSDYRKFGSAMLPGVAVVQQAGREVFRVTMFAADFDSPIPRRHFDIPGSPPSEDLFKSRE